MLDSPAWAPSIEQVAARIMARTRLPNGLPAQTFTSETTPTSTQVLVIINQAVSLMRPVLGPVPDSLVDLAQALAALRSAYMIELAYFPEQVETAMSPYQSLRLEFKDSMKDWDMAARGLEPNSVSNLHSMHVATEYPAYATGAFNA